MLLDVSSDVLGHLRVILEQGGGRVAVAQAPFAFDNSITHCVVEAGLRDHDMDYLKEYKSQNKICLTHDFISAFVKSQHANIKEYECRVASKRKVVRAAEL